MKCFILAGGSGDLLWPLTRKNYPKQFIDINRERSMFQETVALNMPFCDEFYIITNVKYENIVAGQLQPFTDLKYKLLLEEVPLKTAAPVAIAASLCKADEQILIISSDHIIEGGNYNECIFACRKQVEKGHSAVVGMPIRSAEPGYGYIEADGQHVNKMFENVSADLAGQLYRSPKYLWDAGIIMTTAAKLLNTFRIHAPALYHKSIEALEYLDISGDKIILREGKFSSFPVLSLAKAANYYADDFILVRGGFYWNRIMNAPALASYAKEGKSGNAIFKDCDNVSLINEEQKKLVVANGLKDIAITNTKDALYVSSLSAKANAREIADEAPAPYRAYFEDCPVWYEPWGKKEILNKGPGYQVSKITVYAGKSAYMHVHKRHSEYWSIVKGEAYITLSGDGALYHVNQSVFIPVGAAHQIVNKSEDELIFIETSIGCKSAFSDEDKDIIVTNPPFVKLSPAFKDYIWGGDKLKKMFGKEAPFDVVAESWELSAHAAGLSFVDEDEFRGYAFDRYLQQIGKEKLGWKCASFERFPVLVKFLDATDNLSVQVHPGGEYASREGEYGKNEMLYIVDAEKDSRVYIGFNRNVTKEEVEERIDDGSIFDILNAVKVKKGDVYFIEAGTIHAIGKGIVVYEAEQSSNVTYRLYDYNRTDKFGNLRPLHFDKAKDVLSFAKYEPVAKKKETETLTDGAVKETLAECKYFTAVKYTSSDRHTIKIDGSSFIAVTFLAGRGVIRCNGKEEPFRAGDTFFFPAEKKSAVIEGSCEWIQTSL